MISRHKTFDFAGQIDDYAAIEQTRDGAHRLGINRVLKLEIRPRVGQNLLVAQGYPTVFLVDTQNDHVDRVAALHNLRWMLNPAGPGHIRNMHKSVDPILYLHKCAEGGQIANLARNLGAYRIFEIKSQPGIRFELLETKRDLLIFLIDGKNDCFDFLMRCENFRRVLDVLGPGHFEI